MRLLIPALMVSLLAGCQQMAHEPTTSADLVSPIVQYDAPVSVSADVASKSGPERYSNARKYRDSGLPSAHSSEGEFSLTGTALINANGATEMFLHTGTPADPEAKSGTIARAQVKAFHKDGTQLWTRNFNKEDAPGELTLWFDDLHHEATVRVQANVEGLRKGNKGTAVLGFTTMVILGPDMTSQIAEMPETAQKDEPVPIDVRVSEGNGEAGARNACRLYANGEKINEAVGVWVDAGDHVVCRFNPAFREAGRYELWASAEDVTPGDYQPSNNRSESVMLEVTESGGDFSYWAHANVHENEWENVYNGSTYGSASLRRAFHLRDGGLAPMSLPVTLSFSIGSAGDTWREVEDGQGLYTYGWSYGNGYECSRSYDYGYRGGRGRGSGLNLQVCNRPRSPSSISLWEREYGAVYYSESVGGGYDWSETDAEFQYTPGAPILFELKVTGADGNSINATNEVAMTPFRSGESTYGDPSSHYYSRSRYVHHRGTITHTVDQ